MRAARLLQILLILQNRGRQTSAQLAEELEVVPRTILRDVDAMTEAGLPIIVHQGNRGGIELGFDYRTRLTGLAQEESDALGLILSADNPMVGALELTRAAASARAKLIESFPDKTRVRVQEIMTRFRITEQDVDEDPRVGALAKAVQGGRIVRLRFASTQEQTIHPVAMALERQDRKVRDGVDECWIARGDWGRINVSAVRF